MYSIIQNEPKFEDKRYIDRKQHNSNRLLNNNNNKQAFPIRCWKCKAILIYKSDLDGKTGLYCRKCCIFRKFRVERRGVCLWSRVDVKRSGKYKRRVMLDEET